MTTKHSAKEKEGFQKLYSFSSLLLGAAVILCVVFALQVLTRGYVSMGGYSFFRVVTGSMEPTIPVGALLVNQKADIGDISINDIVCYRAMEEDHYGVTVTHRVTNVLQDGEGKVYLETKGDANLTADLYYVEQENLIGRVVWYSKEESVVTNIVSFLGGGLGFLACILIPVLVIAGMVLSNTVRSLQRELSQAESQLERKKAQSSTAEESAGRTDPKDPLLDGYETLTIREYEEIYQLIKEELLGELNREKTLDTTDTTK